MTLADAVNAPAAIAGNRFDAMLVDHALGADTVQAVVGSPSEAVARRIVLITPGERHSLPTLKATGSTGYLVKPVRAASLAARLTANEAFEDTGAAGVAPAVAHSTPISGRSLAVLLAEDNDINALLARSLLSRLGHRPTVVSNGAAALETWRTAQAEAAPFDIVLMDVQMPGIDGLEATRQIRAAEAALGERRTPIVALTANAYAEDREACLAAGMDGFLVKPLDPRPARGVARRAADPRRTRGVGA